jgi:membrane associated rhomboid family serine protease
MPINCWVHSAILRFDTRLNARPQTPLLTISYLQVMATCDVCGEQESMPYQCRHCKGTYCREHRLPESHDCPGLQNWNKPGGVFDSGFDDSANETESSLQTRLSKTGGPLSYFRGNMTFVFLAVMGIMFIIQFFIAPLFGIQPYRPDWVALFTLSSAHPFYVWTWFTSIFAHAGIFHIAANGIILYFFGPIVEDRIGSKKFTALFFVSGIAAGFAQIGLSLIRTQPTALLGASGAIMAIMAVLTVLKPDLRVYLYFIIPVPIWVLTFGYAGLSVLGLLGGLGGGIAHVAHLAGLVIGLAYGQRVKSQGVNAPGQLQLGGGQGPGGPGRGGGPF